MGLEKQRSYRRKERRLLKRLRKKIIAAEESLHHPKEEKRTQTIRVRLWVLLVILFGLAVLLAYFFWSEGQSMVKI
jgi:UDP-N-acetylmuramyl pentapeptide phosphotransferase/UDP-N-acetylglucosamine-1-phosphate transferase